MLIRIRSNIGLWRVDGLDEETARVADVLAGVAATRPHVVYEKPLSMDPACKEFVDPNQTLSEQGLRHGSMVHCRVDATTCADIADGERGPAKKRANDEPEDVDLPHAKKLHHEKTLPSKVSLQALVDNEPVPLDTTPSSVVASRPHAAWFWMRREAEDEGSPEAHQIHALQSDWEHLLDTKEKPTLSDVAALCAKRKVLVGKWLLHVPLKHLDRVWLGLREMLENGLACTAKVAPTAQHGVHLICVYVSDFTSKSQVDACLAGIREHWNPKRLYFKADGMTHLQIYSDNPWKMKVSFYSHDKEKQSTPTSLKLF